MKKTFVNIGDICTTTQGVQIAKAKTSSQPYKGGYQYLYIADFMSNKSLSFVEHDFKEKKVTNDDLVMANTGSPGRVFKGIDGVLSNNLFKISFDKKKVDRDYLYFVLSSEIFQRSLQKQMKGGIHQHLGHKTIAKQKIPLPTIAEQKKIATILNVVDGLRQKDNQLLEQYNALSQSLFLEMFGDNFVNPNNFPSSKLDNLLKKRTDLVDGPYGSSIDTKIDYCQDGEIPVIRTKNISIDNNFITKDLKFMRRAKYETVIWSHVLPGDIVLTKVGTIGNTCIMPDVYKEAVLSTTGSCRIRVNEESINKKYFLYYLNFYKPKMLEIAHVGVQAFLNMTHIRNFDIICPPLNLQNQFAKRIALIEQQKQKAQTGLDCSEALFNSLLQRAFNGDLVR